MTTSKTSHRSLRRASHGHVRSATTQSRAAHAARPPGGVGEGFWYELAEASLRIGVEGFLLRSVPYRLIERVERGWAPGLQVGEPGMPDRGDEVRIRTSDPLEFPWLSLTPPDPDGFVRRLSDRLESASVRSS